MSIKARELPFVRDMFDRIAPRYDFLNRLLSLRQDTLWRRTMVRALSLMPGALVLDAACGTADVMLEILSQTGRSVRVVGIDFSPEMLHRAKSKLTPGTGHGTALAAADVFDLPFGLNRFDAVTMAFGIRNIQNKSAALDRFWGHLKPGGRLAILELVTPSRGVLRAIYLSYFRKMLPLIGRLFSSHRYAYSYLPESVTQFPQPDAFARMMRQAGFTHIRCRPLTFGICQLFIGDRPLE